MKKPNLFFLISFVLIISLISFGASLKMNLTLGDYLELSGTLNLPGAYHFDDKTFWRMDGHFERTKFDYNGIAITIESSEVIGDDATVLFVDAGVGEKRVWGYLENILDNAKKFVYACVYDIDYPPFVKKLEILRKKGIDVKVITELDNRNTACDELKALYDENPKLMHNKFIVVDGYALITGSLNFTVNGFEKNNNNIVIFYSNELAQQYMEEFHEMLTGKFGGGEFRPLTVITDWGYVKAEFTPDDPLATRKIVNLINHAKRSVHIMMFAFTSRDIARALVSAKKRGVDVKVIVEEFQTYNRWSIYDFLKDNGISIIRDKNPGVFHHKVMIVDEVYTLTGSFNYTVSAQRYNDENFLIIESPVISEVYEKKFESYWKKWKE